LTAIRKSARVEVYPFSKGKLFDLFRQKSLSSARVVKKKSQCEYFSSYLSAVKAATIVVENDYTDAHYLADYVGLYARCFPQYGRRCTRLHFFKKDFVIKDFDELLKGNAGNLTRRDLQRSYLGFVVVKPLPETFIGRTCLKTYKWAETRRYPITRNYSVHLYGIDLNVQSLAFQEQDVAAGRCGTAAIWSVFNGTGRLFQHKIPAPFEITTMAAEGVPGEQVIAELRKRNKSFRDNGWYHLNWHLITASNTSPAGITSFSFFIGNGFLRLLHCLPQPLNIQSFHQSLFLFRRQLSCQLLDLLNSGSVFGVGFSHNIRTSNNNI
jgi:hypothetical protein